MTSPILRTTARILLPLLALASVFVLLRGHNEPGGGFVGGLMIAGALALHGLAYGPGSLETKLRVDPRSLVGAGLLASIASGLVGPFSGGTFLEASWLKAPLPGIGKLGTVILFDVGVYLVVLGTTLSILLALWRDDERTGSSSAERAEAGRRVGGPS